MAVDTPARIAVLGAGPVGLEAGLYARFLGYDLELFERGAVAENVLRWGHVRLFTPFCMNRSTLGLAALTAQDPSYRPPDANTPLTGRQWVEQYLAPLSRTDLLADHLRAETDVVAVTRSEALKGDTPGSESRRESSFRILLHGADGREWESAADIVIDTTGVYGNANWIGQGGAPAVGEMRLRDRIEYGNPDVMGADRERYAGARVLVVGSAYSAATTVVALVELAQHAPGTHVTWVTRGQGQHPAEGPIQAITQDPLEARAHLAQTANSYARNQPDVVTHWPGRQIRSVSCNDQQQEWTVVFAGEQEEVGQFDHVVANVGYRPDDRISRELQVQSCYASEGIAKLAATLRANDVAAGLEQPPLGPDALRNPEPDFYVLGAKSYGRNSSFLFSAGLAQIRDVFSVIGDRADLNLYESVKGLLG